MRAYLLRNEGGRWHVDPFGYANRVMLHMIGRVGVIGETESKNGQVWVRGHD